VFVLSYVSVLILLVTLTIIRFGNPTQFKAKFVSKGKKNGSSYHACAVTLPRQTRAVGRPIFLTKTLKKPQKQRMRNETGRKQVSVLPALKFFLHYWNCWSSNEAITPASCLVWQKSLQICVGGPIVLLCSSVGGDMPG